MSESSSEESLPSHSSLLSTWTAVPSLVMVSLTSVLTTKLDSSLVDKILETSRSTDRRKVTSTSSILISCQTAKTTLTGHPLPSWSSRVITNPELMASSTSMTLRSLPWTTPGLLTLTTMVCSREKRPTHLRDNMTKPTRRLMLLLMLLDRSTMDLLILMEPRVCSRLTLTLDLLANLTLNSNLRRISQ